MTSIAAIAAARAQVEAARQANETAGRAFRAAENSRNEAQTAMLDAQANLRTARAELTRLEQDRSLARRLATVSETDRREEIEEAIEGFILRAMADGIALYRKDQRQFLLNRNTEEALGEAPKPLVVAAIGLLELLAQPEIGS